MELLAHLLEIHHVFVWAIIHMDPPGVLRRLFVSGDFALSESVPMTGEFKGSIRSPSTSLYGPSSPQDL